MDPQKEIAFSKDKVMEEEEVHERWSVRIRVLVLQGGPLLVASLPASSSPLGPTLKGKAELSWPQCGSISSLLLISKAHYFVLRLAGSQLESPVPTDGHFLPFRPTLLAIYRDYNLLWWVFRVLFCQGQSGLSNKWSQRSGSGLDPATPPSHSASGRIHFEKFRINFFFCPWLWEEERKKAWWRRNSGGGGSCKNKQVPGLKWTGCSIHHLSPPDSHQGWSNNTNKHLCGRNETWR